MHQASDSGHLKVVERTCMIQYMKDMSTPGKRRARDTDGLTARQRQVLEAIRLHLKVRGLPPSRSELARDLKLSNPSAVAAHLHSLEKAGWLETFPSVERGIRLLREGAPLYEDPAALLELDTPRARGRAVGPKEEPPRIQDFDSFAGLFESPPPDFFLRIKDDSMEYAGYRPGAIVAVVRKLEPCDGDVVVARVDDTGVVRRYTGRDAANIELRPESSNPRHEPVHLRHGSKVVEIVGVVVGQIVAGRGTKEPTSELD